MDRMLPIEFDGESVVVRGIAINPYHSRTSRTPQEIFVNGRAIKNATISHAIYEAYGSFLPKGHHPVFVLFLDIDCKDVDVNVHPSKREVKFSTPDVVHRAVKEAIRCLLQQKSSIISTPDSPTSTLGQSIELKVYGRSQSQVSLKDNGVSFVEGHQTQTSEVGSGAQPKDVVQLFSRDSREGEFVHETQVSYFQEPDYTVRVLGQMSHTYIAAQVGEEFHVIDQHTVHERVLFERLWKSWLDKKVPSQALLIPEPIEVQPHTAALLRAALTELSSLGLEIEPIGERAFVIRAVPSLLRQMDYAALIQDLVDDLTEWKSLDSIEKRIRPILASIACQGAVQAGRPMAEPEMKLVLEDWVKEGFPLTCPHGRRVTMRFSIEELHRIFRRI